MAVAAVVNNQVAHQVVLAAAADTMQVMLISVEVERQAKVMPVEEIAMLPAVVVVVPGVLVQMHLVIMAVMVALVWRTTLLEALNTMRQGVLVELILEPEALVVLVWVVTLAVVLDVLELTLVQLEIQAQVEVQMVI